jgi:Tfp pilus assembly protein FimT
MTVVAIITIAMALAIPSYTRWSAGAELKEALLDLHSSLNLARMTAMNRNTTITVTVAVSSGRVRATFTDPNSTSAACLSDSRVCAMPTLVLPAKVTGVGGTTTFQFSSLGLRAGGGTTTQSIQLSNNQGATYEIQVTAAGKIRWCISSPCA